MKRLLIAMSLSAALSASAGKRVVEFAPDGDRDRGPEVRAALKDGARLRFAPGRYRFSVASMPRRTDHISNHDQPKDHPIAVPLVGLKNVRIEGEGAIFELDGNAIAMAFVDTKRCKVEGVTVDCLRGHTVEAKILSFGDGKTRVSIDRAAFPYKIDPFTKGEKGNDNSGHLRFEDGMGGTFPIASALAFDGKTGELVEGTADIGLWENCHAVREESPGVLVLPMDFSRIHRQVEGAKPLKVGDVLAFRNWGRENPAIFLYRAKDTEFSGVTVHSSCGMGLLAQRSENIAFCGGGMHPLPGRFASTSADATHFSNCKGKIIVSGARFEGMADDAINVHSTCLAIEEKLDARRFRCRYKHHQAVGFEVFGPGERLRFIKGPTLEDGPVVKVSAFEMRGVDEAVVTLAEDAPEGYGKGDAVENADFQPEVAFTGNKVRHNRARGALFNTPGRIECTGNLFERVSGSAILLAGDAQGWYESGACKNVLIARNVFRDNLTSAYQFTNGIISICPEVRNLDGQKARYHRGIVIEDNVFETFDVPLLYAKSVDGLVWRRNRVKRNSRYAKRGGKPFTLDRCENAQIAE
ncbi:MAG: hypothetical protein K6F50_01270 [Kiritimatiellae bacterium]|nr:hypothetical protein [Kiritimatiellia bacterium]